MTRAFAFIATALILACAAAAGPGNPAVGRWDLTATDESGQPSTWTLVVREEAGKLAGELAGPEAALPLLEPKLDGQAFTFKVKINESAYEVQTKIDGDKLEGKFRGPEANGTVKATRKP